MEEQGDCFGSWWGRKSPLVRHQAECWTVWYTFTSAANRNIVKKPPSPSVAYGTCQLHLSHNSVATDGHFYQEHAWWIFQNRPKGLSVIQSCEDSESQGRLSILKRIMTQVECHSSFLPTFQFLLQKIRAKLSKKWENNMKEKFWLLFKNKIRQHA